MIKLRIDVDYPYPSRIKSFLYIALRIKSRKNKDYLRNSRVIARMVNESHNQVKAYWFFTPYTIPDKRLLELMNPERHEVALHVATKPYEELKILENETNRIVNYYTIHGTKRLFARLLWGRKLSESKAKIPRDFPVKSFHEYQTYSLDAIRFNLGFEGAKKAADDWKDNDFVWSIHPEWLFQLAKRNRRGPYYDVLKYILGGVDKDLETLNIRKRASAKIAQDIKEYERSIIPTAEFLEQLCERDLDIFTFIERTWCCPLPNPPNTWTKAADNVGLLEIKSYDDWWQEIGKKTRNMVRRAEKNGVKVIAVEPNEKLAEGIWKIYNETPIRQERAFPHYGESLSTVTGNMYEAKNNAFIGAYLVGELVGFIQILYGENIAIISNILAMQEHWDKSLNNALLAKAVEICASKGVRWLMYGRIGNHPSLDRFKKSNGFVKFSITRYFVPLTGKGKLAIRLGLHRELKDALPNAVKYPLIPVFNWVSRNKVKIKRVKE